MVVTHYNSITQGSLHDLYAIHLKVVRASVRLCMCLCVRACVHIYIMMKTIVLRHVNIYGGKCSISGVE